MNLRKVEKMRERIEAEVARLVDQEMVAALDKLQQKLPAEEFERVVAILTDDETHPKETQTR